MPDQQSQGSCSSGPLEVSGILAGACSQLVAAFGFAGLTPGTRRAETKPGVSCRLQVGAAARSGGGIELLAVAAVHPYAGRHPSPRLLRCVRHPERTLPNRRYVSTMFQ